MKTQLNAASGGRLWYFQVRLWCGEF